MSANKAALLGGQGILLVLTLISLAPAQATVEAVQMPDKHSTLSTVWPETDTVKTLLQAETQAALAQQRPYTQTDHGLSETKIPRNSAADHLELTAIYGIGKNLNVEILINGQRCLYRHGHKWPDEMPDGGGAYSLRSINGRCVMLDSATGTRRVCLSRGE